MKIKLEYSCIKDVILFQPDEVCVEVCCCLEVVIVCREKAFKGKLFFARPRNKKLYATYRVRVCVWQIEVKKKQVVMVDNVASCYSNTLGRDCRFTYAGSTCTKKRLRVVYKRAAGTMIKYRLAAEHALFLLAFFHLRVTGFLHSLCFSGLVQTSLGFRDVSFWVKNKTHSSIVHSHRLDTHQRLHLGVPCGLLGLGLEARSWEMIEVEARSLQHGFYTIKTA